MTRRDWLTEFELVDLLAEKRGDKSLRAFAAELGLKHHQFLSRVMAMEERPGTQLAEALGYEAVTLYRPICSDKKEER